MSLLFGSLSPMGGTVLNGTPPALELGAPFSDHAVLQRNQPIMVWGRAAPGETVSLQLSDRSAETRSDEHGRWEALLPSLEPGGPHRLRVTAGASVIERADLLIGDVWLCSGQSNMAMPVSACEGATKEIADADLPEVRFLTVAPTAAGRPASTFSDNWTICSSSTAGLCSGAAFFFARQQWRAHGVPVGLIVAAVGGSMIQPWISREGYQCHSSLKSFLKEQDLWRDDRATAERMFVERSRRWVREVFRVEHAPAAKASEWHHSACDDQDWVTLQMPGFVEDQGFEINGVFWLRRVVTIPAEWNGCELVLRLGRIDDADASYFNGRQVGTTSFETTAAPWATERTYRIPAECVAAGEASIAVRVSDYSGKGGVSPASKAFNLQVADGSFPPLELAGAWRFQIEREVGPLPPPPPGEIPLARFYNGMIAPLAGYALCGMLWYQGEANAGDPVLYRDLFPALIRDWRARWKNAELPFLFVQLANFDPRRSHSGEADDFTYWVYLREAQRAALQLPKTEMVTTYDIGNAADIHPKNKQEVGRRLSGCADRVAHGLPVVCAGPRLARATHQGAAMRLEFENADDGLVVTGSNPGGFVIAGADRRFYWAEARVEGNVVNVSSSEVSEAVSVRYAWADDPATANLRNARGLPAEAFRLDNWDPY